MICSWLHSLNSKIGNKMKTEWNPVLPYFQCYLIHNHHLIYRFCTDTKIHCITSKIFFFYFFFYLILFLYVHHTMYTNITSKNYWLKRSHVMLSSIIIKNLICIIKYNKPLDSFQSCGKSKRINDQKCAFMQHIFIYYDFSLLLLKIGYRFLQFKL